MTTIRPIPAAPSRNNQIPKDFVNASDAFLASLPGFVSDVNAVAGEVNQANLAAALSAGQSAASANSARDAQLAAAASAAAAVLSTGVDKWVAGTFPKAGVTVWSPKDFQNYRLMAAGVSNTDPADDAVSPTPMWRKLPYKKPWRVAAGQVAGVLDDEVMIDTSAGEGGYTLPVSPIAGFTYVHVKDYANTFGVNKLTIKGNGNKIEGLAEDMTVNQSFSSIKLVFIDNTMGWKIV